MKRKDIKFIQTNVFLVLNLKYRKMIKKFNIGFQKF